MKCQALEESKRERAWFDIESQPGSVGVRVVAPDGKVYWLIREQVERAIVTNEILKMIAKSKVSND